MQVIATPCLAEELKPGDLFSTRGPAYWDNFAEFPSCGELVYIRTEMPASAFPDAESVVFRITIHKEAPSKLAERAAELEWNKPYPHSKAGEGPVTIEQLDILQFGRVLHERPTPSVQEDSRRQRQLIRGRRRPKQNNPDGYPDDVATRSDHGAARSPRTQAMTATLERAKEIVAEAWRQTCEGPGEFDDYAIPLIAESLSPAQALERLARDVAFAARTKLRSAKKPLERAKAIGAEEAANQIADAILSLAQAKAGDAP